MSNSDPWAPRTERGGDPGPALLGAVVAGVLGIAVAFVLSTGAVVGLSAFVGQLSLVAVISIVFVGSAVGLTGTGLAYLSLRNISPRSYLGLGRPAFGDVLWALGGYVGALVAVFGVGFLFTIFQVEAETSNQAVELGIENPELLLWLVPLSLFVVAPGEELLFRGVVQGRLREAFAPRIAIPLTAALFATVHYFSLTGAAEARFVAIAVLFLPSLVFGYAYERTQKLIVPILIHGLYNSTLVLLVYLTIELAGSGAPM